MGLLLDLAQRAAALNVTAAEIEAVPSLEPLRRAFFEGAPFVRAFMEEKVATANAQRADDGEATYLLPAMYTAPVHPSSAHGHATVAGACATVLKAMLATCEEDGTPRAWGTRRRWSRPTPPAPRCAKPTALRTRPSTR